MDADRIAQFVERQIQGWESPAGVADLAADYGLSGTFSHPFDPPATGRDAVQAVYDRFHATCRDALVTLGPIAGVGPVIAFEWLYEFTVRQNGRRTRLPGLTVATLAADQIERWVDYWDSRALYDYIAPAPAGQQRRPLVVVTEPPAFDADALLARQIAGWDDPAALEAMYADWHADATFRDPITPPTGLAGLRDVFEQAHRLTEQIETAVHRRVGAGRSLSFEWTVTYRGRRSGRPGRMDGASWVEVRDGRIVAWRDYWDTEQIRPRRGISRD